MTEFLTRQLRHLVNSVLDPLETAGIRLLGTAGIAGLAIACLIAAIAFLSIALDQWLAQMAGPVIAALGAAGFYLVIVVICFLVLRLRNGAKAKTSPVQQIGKSEAATNIEETIAPFVAILHDSGMKREEVAVRLGTEMAKQFGPLVLVASALVAGFILQRSLVDSKKPPQ